MNAEKVVKVVAELTTALTLYEKVKHLLHDLLSKLPTDKKKREVEQDLTQPEEAMQLAKVEIAKGFGYPLCLLHFPPGIKLCLEAEGQAGC